MFLDGGDPDSGGDALAATAFPDSMLADPALRSEETGGLASRVSVHPAVRQALTSASAPSPASPAARCSTGATSAP